MTTAFMPLTRRRRRHHLPDDGRSERPPSIEGPREALCIRRAHAVPVGRPKRHRDVVRQRDRRTGPCRPARRARSAVAAPTTLSLSGRPTDLGGIELPGDRARRLTPVFYERLLLQFEERRQIEIGDVAVEPWLPTSTLCAAASRPPDTTPQQSFPIGTPQKGGDVPGNNLHCQRRRDLRVSKLNTA